VEVWGAASKVIFILLCLIKLPVYQIEER
jgi:hypothetical protein